MLVAFRCLLIIICYPRVYSVHVTIENRAVLQSPETEHGLHLGSDDNNLDTFFQIRRLHCVICCIYIPALEPTLNQILLNS